MIQKTYKGHKIEIYGDDKRFTFKAGHQLACKFYDTKEKALADAKKIINQIFKKNDELTPDLYPDKLLNVFDSNSDNTFNDVQIITKKGEVEEYIKNVFEKMNVSAGTVLMEVKKALKWLPKDPAHRAESLKLLARYFPEEQLKNPSDVKPPKYWWDYMVDKIKKDSPSYTKKQIAATIGDIWYHGLTQAKRNEIIKKAWK